MWLPTCSGLLAAGSALLCVSGLQWAHVLQAAGGGAHSLPALLQLSAAVLSAARCVGVASQGTSDSRLSTLIAIPLMKIRTWDQTLINRFSGGKGEPAVTAGNRAVIHPPIKLRRRVGTNHPLTKIHPLGFDLLSRSWFGLDTTSCCWEKYVISCSTPDSSLNPRCS